jgi:dUTP pyrophosphatase
VDLKIKMLDASLPAPRFAKSGDAGLDLASAVDAEILPGNDRKLIPTGVAVGIPPGYAGLILPRSGLALNHGITCLNSPGLIDSGYRGELKCILVNTDPKQSFFVKRGDRVAQLVIIEVPQITLLPVDELEATERGEQGFGHSGR